MAALTGLLNYDSALRASEPCLSAYLESRSAIFAPHHAGTRPIGIILSNGRPFPHLMQQTGMQAFQLFYRRPARASTDWQERTDEGTKSGGYWAVNVSRVPGTHSSRFHDFKTFCSLNVSVYR